MARVSQYAYSSFKHGHVTYLSTLLVSFCAHFAILVLKKWPEMAKIGENG